MRRSLPVLLLAALAVGAVPFPASATPTSADPAYDASRSGVRTGDVHAEWGSTAGHDARLRKGCRSYRYTYALTPPDGDWALETFLVGPRGKRYGSGYFLTGKDPLAGPGAWRLCLRSTRAGTYTIRARLTVDNAVDYYDGWLPESTFRLRTPRR